MLRPNSVTRAELLRRRRLTFRTPLQDDVDEPLLWISTHVRHGDKGLETALVAANEYFAAAHFTAQALRRRRPGPAALDSDGTAGAEGDAEAEAMKKKLKLKLGLFVSTEDPEVVAAADQWAAGQSAASNQSAEDKRRRRGAKEVAAAQEGDDEEGGGGRRRAGASSPAAAADPRNGTAAATAAADMEWEVAYVSVARANLPIFGLVSAFGGVQEMLNGLLNLQLSVELGSGWVCTSSSNWCGLIDELRATVAAKAHLPFVDIGSKCFQGCVEDNEEGEEGEEEEG